jgi:hypothetical protein
MYFIAALVAACGVAAPAPVSIVTTLPAAPSCHCQARAPTHLIKLGASEPRAPLEGERYGHDPRADLTGAQCFPTHPDIEWAANYIEYGRICELHNVGQLQAALTVASSAGVPMVVVRCVSQHCHSCAQTSTLYADAAAEFGSNAIFCTTVCSGSGMAFCKLAGIKAVPSVMVFGGGELACSMRLSRRDWPAFYAQLLAITQPGDESRRRGFGGLTGRVTRYFRRKRLQRAARDVGGSSA